MSSHVVIPVLVSFAISLVLGPVVIPFLRKLKMRQTERVEGVQSHLKKAGTPTMGGIIILISVIVTSLFYVKDYPKIIPILFLTVAFGLIGFLDDYLKVVLKRSDGLMPMQKMALQIIVTAIFAFYLVKVADIPLTMLVPFSNGYYLDLGWVAVPVLFVAVIGTVNGTNFTDGLDGLASSVTVLVATFFTGLRAASSRSPVQWSGRCSDSCCLMCIRQACSWEIPARLRSADLWQARLICFRCRCLSSSSVLSIW